MAIVLSTVLVILFCVALDMLKNQGRKIESIMANFGEIKQLLVDQKLLIEEIAGDQAELLEKLAGIITTEETQVIFNALKENVAKLKEVAAVIPEPEPPVDPMEPG